MNSNEEMAAILGALPDPAFVITRSGKYVAVFGGRDTRYYHDGSGLVGQSITDVIESGKAEWFLELIDRALQSGTLVVEEYELSNRDVKGLPDQGPEAPIWFEARIQALGFRVEDEPVVLWVASNISERHELEIKLRELSETDQLTGLANRRRLERELARQYETFVRHGAPTAVIMFDLDNLKKINDVRGHHAGDETIRAVSDICRSELRKTDTACRFGGDEFVIVLPSTGYEQAAQFAERLRRVFRDGLSRFSVGDAVATTSIGVTAMTGFDRSYEDTLRRADDALYEAKGLGKDRVVAA